MPPSAPKRRRGGSARSRGRKKQKRLDAIHDVAPVSAAPAGVGGGESEDSDPEGPRRSTRVRRAPALLDTSPFPSPRRKRARGGGGVAGSSGGSSRRRSRGRARGEAGGAREIGEEEEEEDDEAGSVVWRSRLRDRVKGKARLERRVRSLWFDEDYEVELKEEEEEQVRKLVVDVREGAVEEGIGEGSGGLPMQWKEVRDREINLTIDLNLNVEERVSMWWKRKMRKKEAEQMRRKENELVVEMM